MTASTRPPLMVLETALAQLLEAMEPVPHTETVNTFDADGRVLAEAVVSPLEVPGHDNTAMDGYAVRVADVQAAIATGAALPVLQRIAAGHVGETLAPGTVARIFTGAPVPPGADAVMMQEDAQMADPTAQGHSQVTFTYAPPQGQWIRRQGEDIRQGAVVLPQGTRLQAQHVGLAASMGCAALTVRRPVRVALLSTGDELVMPGDVTPDQLQPGHIYNSNRFFLKAMLQRLGCDVTDFGIVPDQREATLDTLAQAALSHDLIVTSGGVSVGEEDHMKPAVQQLGGLHVWQIAMKPGKPFAFGWVGHGPQGAGRSHFVGLPGNPVSSFVTFLLLVRPLILRLSGMPAAGLLDMPAPTPMPAHFAKPQADKRREFLRVRRNAQGGLDVFSNQSSGVLTSVVWADGLVDHPAGSTIAEGDMVWYRPLSCFF